MSINFRVSTNGTNAVCTINEEVRTSIQISQPEYVSWKIVASEGTQSGRLFVKQNSNMFVDFIDSKEKPQPVIPDFTGKTGYIMSNDGIQLVWIQNKMFEVKMVDVLPETGEPNTIYFVPSATPGEKDTYDEFMYIEGKWEKIGNTGVTIEPASHTVAGIVMLADDTEVDLGTDDEKAVTSKGINEVYARTNTVNSQLAQKADISTGVWQKGEGEGSIVSISNASQGGQSKGNFSVAEGFGSDAKGDYSHTEGQLTTTNGGCAHAEGQGTTARGNCSHAEGMDTIAQNQSEHAEGQFNKSHIANNTFGNAGNTIHSIGIGTGAGSLEQQDRRNAVEIMQNGNIYMLNVGDYNGADFEGAKTVQNVINQKADKSELEPFATYFSSFKKIAPYLGYIDVTPKDLDYQWAMNYFEQNFHNKTANTVNSSSLANVKAFSCSAVRNGKFVGRNLDWIYDEECSVVVHTQQGLNTHASVGTVAVFPGFTDAYADSRLYDREMFKKLPFVMVDGINDAGIFVADLVVPTGDRGKTTGTHPDKAGDAICAIMLPRYILDHFGDLESIITWFENDAKIYCPYGEELQQELHFIVGDKQNTYAVEFINNEVVITPINDKPYITNFYLAGVTYNADSSLNYNSISDHGEGLERYELIRQGFNTTNSEVGMASMMRDTVRYTKTYDLTLDKPWYTEFTGKSERFGELTIHSTPEQFAPIMQYAKSLYDNRTRDESSPYFGTAQTVHSCVFDLENKSMNIVVQENADNQFEFSVSPNPDQDAGIEHLLEIIAQMQQTINAMQQKIDNLSVGKQVEEETMTLTVE